MGLRKGSRVAFDPHPSPYVEGTVVGIFKKGILVVWDDNEHEVMSEDPRFVKEIDYTIRGLSVEAFDTAVEKGWHDTPLHIGSDINVDALLRMCALMHSEISEGVEAVREGKLGQYRDQNGKLQGFVVEMADVLIRIGDTCAALQLDLARAVVDKMAYNKTRPRRHGGKLA